MSPLVMAAIVGGAAFLFVAYQRRQSSPAPAASARSVIDLAAIQAEALRKAAEVISGQLIDKAAASHIAAHSTAAAPAPPAPPKEPGQP